MICRKDDPRSAQITAECLASGGVAILPTDTVYGFSGVVDVCSGGSFRTDDRIRAIKGRSESKPLIQLIASPHDISLYTDITVPERVLKCWPGALTVIVPVKADAPFTDKVPSVAFRCPGDAWLRKVISLCGAPVYSTSVNRSGKPVLDTVRDIMDEFGPEVDLFVDDGDKKGALPSTIVTLLDGEPEILRQGVVRI